MSTPTGKYAGDLNPDQAWAKLLDGAILVDVRTEHEWAHVGVPDTSAVDSPVRFVQWNLQYGHTNPHFLDELAAVVAPEQELVFLCRSGVRSVAAAEAATRAGYTSFNVKEGFEGAQDANGERTVNGWRNRGLPWTARA